MLHYQLYLLAEGAICARLEVLADDDAEALESAAFLLDASSDVCSSYELWSGSRMLAQGDAGRSPIALETLSSARQTQMIDLEETLYSSHWCLAKSVRLGELIDTAHKESRMENRLKLRK